MPVVSTSAGLNWILDTPVSRTTAPNGSTILVRMTDGFVMSVQPPDGPFDPKKNPGGQVEWRDPKAEPNWQPGAYEACIAKDPVVCYAPIGQGGPAYYFAYSETIPNG